MASEQSFRVPVINQLAYTVFVQGIRFNDELLVFVHCDVRDWTPVTFKRLRSDWTLFVDLFNGPLFALNEQGDEKHRQFLALFGFEFLTETIGEDGLIRNVFILQKTPQEKEE